MGGRRITHIWRAGDRRDRRLCVIRVVRWRDCWDVSYVGDLRRWCFCRVRLHRRRHRRRVLSSRYKRNSQAPVRQRKQNRPSRVHLASSSACLLPSLLAPRNDFNAHLCAVQNTTRQNKTRKDEQTAEYSPTAQLLSADWSSASNDALLFDETAVCTKQSERQLQQEWLQRHFCCCRRCWSLCSKAR
jgi:hypothetical protein